MFVGLMKQHNVIIAGSRSFDDYEKLSDFMDTMISSGVHVENVVCGEASGADELGRLWAEKNRVSVISMPADWDKYGKRAGYIRNSQMAVVGTVLIAFWDGVSKGTKHMIDIATKKKIPTYIVRY